MTKMLKNSEHCHLLLWHIPLSEQLFVTVISEHADNGFFFKKFLDKRRSTIAFNIVNVVIILKTEIIISLT